MTWTQETHLQGIWKQPKPKFRRGQYVIFDEQIFPVIAATHTHVQLQGLEYAVPEWECKLYKRHSSVETEQAGISA